MDIRQEQVQKQVVSQSMIQSMNILQLNSIELAEYLKEASMENPVIELEDSAVLHPENEFDKHEERIKKLEWLQNLDEQNWTYYRDDSGEDEVSPINLIKDEKSDTISDILMQQLITGKYSDKELKIFRFIAESLDSKGYYTDNVELAAKKLNITKAEMEKCLDIMRNLEPAGICAAGLEACLLKQLDDYEDTELERKIISEFLPLLAKNQLPVIAKKLHASIHDINRAVERIKSLNPRPGAGYDYFEKVRYNVPDVNVVRFQDRFEILINNYSYPVMHISKTYVDMLRSNCGEDVKDYLLKKIDQAEKIQSNIVRRNSTLLELTKSIVKFQIDFFNGGEKFLKPLTLKKVADDMNVHESTVSRAVKDKFLQCCHGTYPISFFFHNGVENKDKELMATSTVKQKIREIIKNEDSGSPLNDEQISAVLLRDGITISRRTVVKYREAMGIPNSRGRKQFLE